MRTVTHAFHGVAAHRSGIIGSYFAINQISINLSSHSNSADLGDVITIP